MAKDGTMNFEVPAEMREFAEKSVAQAKQAFDGFIAATQHAVGTAETQAKTMQTGAKEAGELAMTLCRAQRRGLVRIRPEAAQGQGRPGNDRAADRIY